MHRQSSVSTAIHTSVLPWEVEVGHPLLVQANVPPHHNVFLGLRLLHPLVIVCLQLNQGTKDVLVLVSILIAAEYRHSICT